MALAMHCDRAEADTEAVHRLAEADEEDAASCDAFGAADVAALPVGCG